MDKILAVLIASVVLSRIEASGFEQPYYSQSHGDQAGGYMSDWSVEWDQGALQQQKCIDIPQNMSLCKDIGYTQMRLPNLLDHDTVREVTQQSSSWVPLLGIRCHPDTKLFLCSLFSPVCLDRPIWPCRTLCEAVKNGCEAMMLKYGFPWPEMLRCDKFPLDNDLCIGLQHDNKPVVETPVDDSVCEACNQPETYEAMIDNYCSAEFVYRIEIEDNVVSGADLKITTERKKKKVKAGTLSERELRNMILYVNNGANCECRHLTNLQSSRTDDRKSKKTFLAMGSRKVDKLVLQYLVPYEKSSKDLKRAMKSMRKGDICKDGLDVLQPLNSRKSGRKNSRDSVGRPENNDKQVNDNTRPSGRDDDENGKKNVKKCKNPKKCVSSDQPEESRKRDKRRRKSQKQRAQTGREGS